MKLFKTVKKIISKEGVLHFKRFAIIECKYFNIYVHTILQADKDLHLHDHPWSYTSIVLKGELVEQTRGNKFTNLKLFDVIERDAEESHKIFELKTPSVTTLFFTGPRKRDWGYWVKGKWINNATYRKIKNK